MYVLSKNAQDGIRYLKRAFLVFDEIGEYEKCYKAGRLHLIDVCLF